MEDIHELFEKGPKAFDAKEFAEREFSTPPTVVHPFFPSGGVGIIFGEGGVGKTRLALHMAMAVRDGSFFLARFRCTKGIVGLVEVDTAPSTVQDMLRKMAGLAKKEGEKTGGYYDLSGMPIALHDRAVDAIALSDAIRREGDEARPAWLEPVRTAKCSLVIVDSYRKTHRLDENDNRTPSAVIGAWRTLLGSKPALLFIHHARKDAPGFMTTRGASSSSRGASALIDDNDWSAHLYKEVGQGKETKLKVLEWTKARVPGEDQMPKVLLDYDERTGLLMISDRARHRALELAEVGLERNEIVKHLVLEQVCTQGAAYKLADEVGLMVRNQ